MTHLSRDKEVQDNSRAADGRVGLGLADDAQTGKSCRDEGKHESQPPRAQNGTNKRKRKTRREERNATTCLIGEAFRLGCVRTKARSGAKKRRTIRECSVGITKIKTQTHGGTRFLYFCHRNKHKASPTQAFETTATIS